MAEAEKLGASTALQSRFLHMGRRKIVPDPHMHPEQTMQNNIIVDQ